MMRLIVGISGATGPIYGIRLLETLKKEGTETHLIITSAAKISQEASLRTDPSTRLLVPREEAIQKIKDQIETERQIRDQRMSLMPDNELFSSPCPNSSLQGAANEKFLLSVVAVILQYSE